MSILQDNSYKVEELRTIKELRDIYSEYSTKEAWLFLSLGGFHGTTLTLDDLDLLLADQSNIASSINGRWWITGLVVFPQLTSVTILNFAEVMIDSDDIPWLREKVRETLINVEASQYGNT